MSVNAFLITTKPKTNDRITHIRDRLERFGFDVTIIEGVKGAELDVAAYFQQTRFWRHRSGHQMTPSELGCTLSHQKALWLAADTNAKANLFLEDDFEASDDALRWIVSIGDRVPTGTLLHLGGQEGLHRQYRFARAYRTDALREAAELHVNDLRFIKRTVAYMVDATTARKLASLVQNGAYLIDDFEFAHSKGAFNRLLFRWVVSHPFDLKASEIEGERDSERMASESTHWTLKNLHELTYRRRMKWLMVWRKLTTPPSRFLINQQSCNQLPTQADPQHRAKR
jgi:glycosyl transferase family 25